MKYSFVIFLAIVCLLFACHPKAEVNPLMVELEADLSGVTAARIQTADGLYEDYMRNNSGRFNDSVSMHGKLHVLCKKFYASADSLTQSFAKITRKEDMDAGLDVLDSIYNATTDSIVSWFPAVFSQSDLHRSDYKESSLSKSALLTSTRMQYDVAMNEIIVLQSETRILADSLRYEDDDAGVTTNRFPAPGRQYSFSVNNKFIQQFAAREIVIDSIKKDGQLLDILPVVDNRDIFRVVELHDLKKGKYVVRIGIGDSFFFPHRFQVK